MNSPDWRYIAGLVEGEGCIGITKFKAAQRRKNPTYAAFVAVQMLDKEPIAYLQKSAPGGFYSFPQSYNGKPCFSWRVNANKAASFLERIAPFLKSRRKKKSVRLALALTKRMVRRGSRPVPTKELRIRERLFKHSKDKKWYHRYVISKQNTLRKRK